MIYVVVLESGLLSPAGHFWRACDVRMILRLFIVRLTHF